MKQMKKSLIVISIIGMTIAVMSCATMAGNFNKMEYPVKMTSCEYTALTTDQQLSFCYGYLMACSQESGGQLYAMPINAVELKTRINKIIKTDDRVESDTYMYYIIREAVYQVLQEKQKASA